jgi:hypothetical protein
MRFQVEFKTAVLFVCRLFAGKLIQTLWPACSDRSTELGAQSRSDIIGYRDRRLYRDCRVETADTRLLNIHVGHVIECAEHEAAHFVLNTPRT